MRKSYFIPSLVTVLAIGCGQETLGPDGALNVENETSRRPTVSDDLSVQQRAAVVHMTGIQTMDIDWSTGNGTNQGGVLTDYQVDATIIVKSDDGHLDLVGLASLEIDLDYAGPNPGHGRIVVSEKKFSLEGSLNRQFGSFRGDFELTIGTDEGPWKMIGSVQCEGEGAFAGQFMNGRLGHPVEGYWGDPDIPFLVVLR